MPNYAVNMQFYCIKNYLTIEKSDINVRVSRKFLQMEGDK